MNIRSALIYIGMAAVLALSSYLLFAHIGAEPFVDYDEAAYAEVVRQTFAEGRGIFSLYFDHELWIDKPPMYLWAGYAFQKFFGLTPEVSMRLPSAIAALLCILMIGVIAHAITGRKTVALASSAILMTIPAFMEPGRAVKFDSLITLCILFGIYCFLKSKENQKWLIGIGAAAGFGVMVKSVVGFLVLPIIFIFSLFIFDARFTGTLKQKLAAYAAGTTAWLRNSYFWIGAALGAAILLPWHGYMALAYGMEFFEKYFFNHVYSRYVRNIFENGATGSSHFTYLDYYAAFWIAGSAVAVILSALLWKRMDAGLRQAFLPAAIAALFIFLVFVFSKTIVPMYFIPMYPFMALAVAVSVVALAERFPRLKYAVAAAFIIATGFAFNDTRLKAFHLDPRLSYAQEFAAEERAIGLILKNEVEDGTGDTRSERLRTQNALILFEAVDYWETVRYYSGGKVFQRYAPLDPTETADRIVPYYLILKSSLVHEGGEFTWLRDTSNASPLYSGTQFSLYEVYSEARNRI